MSFENPFSKKPGQPPKANRREADLAKFKQAYAAGTKSIEQKPFAAPPAPRRIPSGQEEKKEPKRSEQEPAQAQRKPRLMRSEPTVEEMLMHGSNWRPSVEDYLAHPERYREDEDDEPDKKK